MRADKLEEELIVYRKEEREKKRESSVWEGSWTKSGVARVDVEDVEDEMERGRKIIERERERERKRERRVYERS